MSRVEVAPHAFPRPASPRAGQALALVDGPAGDALAGLLLGLLAVQGLGRPFPWQVYLVASGLLSLLLARRVWQGRGWVAPLLLTALLARGFYYLATRAESLPMGDAYGQYGVLAWFLTVGRLLPYPAETYPALGMGTYPQWPLLQALGVAVARVTGVGAFGVALWLPWALTMAWVLGGLALADRLGRWLGLPPLARQLAVVLVLFWPLGYFVPQFKYDLLGAGLVALLAWAVAFPGLGERVGLRWAVALLALGVPLAHPYVTLAGLFWLGSALALLWLLARKGGLPSPPLWLFPVGGMALAVLYLWWFRYVEIRPLALLALNSILKFLRDLASGRLVVQPLGSEYLGRYPAEGVPGWGPPLLWGRDLLLLGGLLAGLAGLARDGRRDPRRALLAGLIALVGGVALATWGLGSFFLRVPGYFVGPVALGIGVGVALWPWRGKGLAVGLFLALLVWGGLVGQWARSYLPRHLYDPSVSFEAVGEHPPGWRRLTPLVPRWVEVLGVWRVLTDEVYITSALLPVQEWRRVQVLGFRGGEPVSGSLVLGLRGLRSTEGYFPHGAPYFRLEDYTPEKVRRFLDGEANRLYDEGRFQAWWIP